MPDWYSPTPTKFDFSGANNAMAVDPALFFQKQRPEKMSWVSADGRHWHLSEMYPEHRYNLLKWLERVAGVLYMQATVKYYLPTTQNPQEWLASTPFYKGLQTMLALDPPPAEFVNERRAINRQRWGQE